MKLSIGDILCITDWITPMLMIGQMAFGGMKPIEILDSGKHRGYQIVKILKENGVKVGTGQIFGGHMDINVDDPVLAGKILAQYGIVTDHMPQPTFSAPVFAPTAKPAEIAAPSPVQHVNQVLDNMLGGIDQLEV